MSAINREKEEPQPQLKMSRLAELIKIWASTLATLVNAGVAVYTVYLNTRVQELNRVQ